MKKIKVYDWQKKLITERQEFYKSAEKIIREHFPDFTVGKFLSSFICWAKLQGIEIGLISDKELINYIKDYTEILTHFCEEERENSELNGRIKNLRIENSELENSEFNGRIKNSEPIEFKYIIKNKFTPEFKEPEFIFDSFEDAELYIKINEIKNAEIKAVKIWRGNYD